jgi:hypothetical protein
MIAMASNGHLEATVMAKHTGLATPHALFDADTAPDAKELGDKRDLIGGLHLDTEFAWQNDANHKFNFLRTIAVNVDEHRPIFTTGHDFCVEGLIREAFPCLHSTIGCDTYFFALLRAALGFAAIVIDDRYARDLVCHDGEKNLYDRQCDEHFFLPDWVHPSDPSGLHQHLIPSIRLVGPRPHICKTKSSYNLRVETFSLVHQ